MSFIDENYRRLMHLNGISDSDNGDITFWSFVQISIIFSLNHDFIN